jgi:hypothetical protein
MLLWTTTYGTVLRTSAARYGVRRKQQRYTYDTTIHRHRVDTLSTLANTTRLVKGRKGFEDPSGTPVRLPTGAGGHVAFLRA